MRPDPILDHSLRPGARGRMKSREYDVTYLINGLGLRDDEPEPGSIMILGDSFMEGYGVERGEILADRLATAGFPAVNAGVKSYSPLLEYLYLRHRGLELRPDTVLLFLDLSDPANDAYYARRLVRDESGRPLSITPRRSRLPLPSGALSEWLDRNSALYAYGIHLALKHFPASDGDIGYSGAAEDLDLLFPGRDSLSDTEFAKGWDVTFEAFKEIRDLLSGRNIFFAVITYPYGHQVSPDAWSEGRKAWNFPPGVSSDRPFRFVETFCAAESIPVFSLDRTFRAHENPGSLYFTWDGHWTAKGHAVAAEAVELWMRNAVRSEE